MAVPYQPVRKLKLQTKASSLAFTLAIEPSTGISGRSMGRPSTLLTMEVHVGTGATALRGRPVQVPLALTFFIDAQRPICVPSNKEVIPRRKLLHLSLCLPHEKPGRDLLFLDSRSQLRMFPACVVNAVSAASPQQSLRAVRIKLGTSIARSSFRAVSIWRQRANETSLSSADSAPFTILDCLQCARASKSA